MDQNSVLVSVQGMTCNHCVRNVENKLRGLENVQHVQASFERSEVRIEGRNIDLEQVKNTIESLGYTYSGEKHQ